MPLQSAIHGYAHFGGSLLRDMRTMPVNSNDASPPAIQNFMVASSTGRMCWCAISCVGCDNVNMGAFSW